MSQRNVERLIGQLLTDEGLRRRFVADPAGLLREMCEQGLELTASEIVALLSTDSTLWDSMPKLIDPRLQKADLK